MKKTYGQEATEMIKDLAEDMTTAEIADEISKKEGVSLTRHATAKWKAGQTPASLDVLQRLREIHKKATKGKRGK